jgi:predicted RNase H-like HicB family nuclease
MFIAYIQAAMRRAKYELLADHEGFVATIPGFKGLIAHAESLEACREELQEVLQSWMLLRMDEGLPLPVIEGLDLNCTKHNKRQARTSRTTRKVA